MRKSAATQRSALKIPTIGLATKVLVLVTLLILLGSSLTTLVISHLSLKGMREELTTKLLSIATTATVAINPEQIKLIQRSEDENSVTYRELQQKLQLIQKNCHDKLRYIYVIAKRGENYVYIVDATPRDAADHSPVGDEFPILNYPAAQSAFRHATADPEPSKDVEFGIISQSGYAPIRDASGDTIAILGIDMDISKIKADEHKIIAAAVHTLVFSLFTALILGIVFSRYLIAPFQLLMAGTRRIAEGDFETKIQMKRRDEFGILANSFNAMMNDLKKTRDQLTEMNVELEKKVFERTSQLQQTNQALAEILDHMAEGIVTINPDLNINPQYSRSTESIFECTGLSGRRIENLLFPGQGDVQLKSELVEWLKLVFEIPVLVWNNMERIQPVRNLAIRVTHPGGKAKTKYLQLSFRPIELMDGNTGRTKVVKIMMIINDHTEKKNLESRAQQYRDNLNEIMEVIHLDCELFMMFLNDCRDQLHKVEPMLIQLQKGINESQLIDDLLRTMHTLKGNAAQFKLGRVAAGIHELESMLSQIRKQEINVSDQLLIEFFEQLDRLHYYLDELEQFYVKVTQGEKAGVDKLLSVQRNEEVNTVKVKVAELDTVIELMQKAAELEERSSNAMGLRQILAEGERHLQGLKRVPIARLFDRFPRMIKCLATELGKDIDLRMVGTETVIDRAIFDRMGDPLIHILRNAVDHGIETPEERLRAGKPAQGKIEISVNAEKDRLIIDVQNDGRGIDLNKVKEKAIAKGLITPEQAVTMTDEESILLLYTPGFSTADHLTQISGRGFGMDVIKKVMDELSGTVQFVSHPDAGVRITLIVPQAGYDLSDTP